MPTGIYNHKPRSKETIEKIRQANLGKHHSIETRAKISRVQKGKHNSPNTEFVKGLVPWNKGKKMVYKSGHHPLLGKSPSAETLAKMREAKLGNRLSEGTKRRMSKAHKGKKRSEEHQRKLAESQRGEKSHFWKGGTTPINKIIRTSMEYKLWRETVFARDDWTCIWCGVRGGKLNVDHIKPFSHHPELRFAIENGRTLCKDCHKKTPTYGGRTR